MTGNRLPSSMLIQFSVTTHPRTKHPWLVPQHFGATTRNSAHESTELIQESTELIQESAEPLQETSEPDPEYLADERETAEPDPEEFAQEQDAVGQPDELSATKPVPTSDQPLYKPAPGTPSAAGPGPPNFYITASYPLMAYWTSLRTRHKVYSFPAKFRAALGSRLKDLVIREDMPDFILGLFRARIIRILHFLANATVRDIGYLAGSNNVRFVGTVQQAAIVVVLGGSELCKEVSRETKAERTRKGMDGGELAVYDLQEMLGEEGMRQLRVEGKGYAESVLRFDVLVVKRKKRTVHLVKELWKMRGYMHGMEKIIRDEGGRKMQGRGVR